MARTVASARTLASARTAVSAGGIDQSQTTQDTFSAIGDSGGTDYVGAQSFIPGEAKLLSVDVYKVGVSGTPAGDLVVEIRSDNANTPSTLVLSSATVTLATFNGWSVDFHTLSMPVSLNPGQRYWIVCRSSVATESTNQHYQLGRNSAGGYASGKFMYTADGGAWTDLATQIMTFRTNYGPFTASTRSPA